ncbi:MAG TPA: bifunctional diaminohydroxyphosphoribosylaminopyrimidine deaminase/5-amino-6-(5-phosphoribosylamino)uracil reductase RibD [Candidatus Binatia bacterium]|nr:bifunctional diaminohydroxyphosphoribosylaminopyrimidine deaminase/5-amino-6-(5-phosphoribosylamino)uracil reductase RibD [Candidatus Binatia bacterium]
MAESSWSVEDGYYLRMARRLAQRAAGRTSPNPIVGAVIVRNGKIVGTGYHRFAGGDHAEIIALKRAGARAKGATLYITLEPCSHQGRTPPCTRALIGAGIKEVVAGTRDPNPRVAGRGFERLKRAGIRVRIGLQETECRALIEVFAKFIVRRTPFITLKLAASLDGKIAAASGDARWISNAASRRWVHQLRNQVDAVLVGLGTVRADNPQLTCRMPGGRNPWRVILDDRLRMPLTAKVLHQRDPQKTIVVTTALAPAAKARALQRLGAQVWRLPMRRHRIAWRPLLRKLASAEIVSVMIEGGATVAASALREKIVDKIIFFYAPKVLGGDGLGMIGGLGIRRVRQSVGVKKLTVKKSGSDFVLIGYL